MLESKIMYYKIDLYLSKNAKWLVYFSLVFIFNSCADKDTKKIKENFELSENNKVELEKVIDYYKEKPKDSLKLKAAYFLILNMGDKYFLTGKATDNFPEFLNSLRQLKSNSNYEKLEYHDGTIIEVDSIWKRLHMDSNNYDNLKIKEDLKEIKADILIENIEFAFKAWGFPWSKEYSFEQFCNYILPYRFSIEELHSWRPIILDKYKITIDSLVEKNITDPYQVSEIFNSKLTKWWKFEKTVGKYPYPMTVSSLFEVQMGSCLHQTQLNTYVMRAIGIPVAHEFIPNYGNRSLGHEFIGLITKEGKTVDFEIGNYILGDVITKRLSWNFSIPKIYRRHYNSNFQLLESNSKNLKNIPILFQGPGLSDVTDQYVPVSDIKLKIEIPEEYENEIPYLAVFDNKVWKIVALGENIEQGYAHFFKLGREIVYLPVFFRNNKIVPAANPFLLDKKGNVSIINPTNKVNNVVLKRKYWLKSSLLNSFHLNFKLMGMKNESKQFETIINLKDTLKRLIPHSYNLPKISKYHRLRVSVPSNSKLNLSEIQFFDPKGEQLFGEYSSSPNIRSIENLFDDNVLSFVEINENSSESWINIDFNDKLAISSFKIYPRTDKNDVWPGLTYELFYWNGQWQSLGVQRAEDFNLQFSIPVANALYLLRCIDEGEEERIFLYQNGKQIWY